MDIREWLYDEFTIPYVSMLLKTMASAFNLIPSLKRNLFREDLDGDKFFNGVYVFRINTKSRGDSVYFSIKDGKASAGIGSLENPDVIGTFTNAQAMRRFFSASKDADPLGLLLNNELAIQGNLAHLSRFGHLVAVFRNLFQTSHNHNYDKLSSLGGMKRQKTRLSCLQKDGCRYLDDPYLSSFSIEDFPRLKTLKERFFETLPEVCIERPLIITRWYMENQFNKAKDGTPHHPVKRQGALLKHLLENRIPIIHDDALLGGSTTTKAKGVLLFPEFSATAIWSELTTLDKRKINPYRIDQSSADILNRIVFPFWVDKNIREWARKVYRNPVCQQLEEKWVLFFLWKVAAISHTIPNYEKVLKQGLIGIKEDIIEAKEKMSDLDSRDALEGMQMAIDGVIAYASHLADRAEFMAKTTKDAQRARELHEIAKMCRKCPASPADTLHEALQSIWIVKIALHMENMNAGLSLGRLDQILMPYFAKDIERCSSKEEREAYIRKAIELIGGFMLQCNDHVPLVPEVGNRLFGGSSSDMALTIGGVRRDGESAVNDMTYIILKTAEMLVLRDPNLNARYFPEINSLDYLKRLCEVNIVTTATPSIHNDKAIIESLCAQGFPIQDARDWGATGCVEPTICGTHMGHTNCMLLNTVAPFEMVFYNGVHPLIKTQVGLATGDITKPDQFPSFESFLSAYKMQLGYMIDRACEYNNILGKIHQELHPVPLLSALIDGCIENGKDAVYGGARYNSSGCALVSLVDVIDSLITVKKLVYEEGKISLKELRDAMESDFQGYESLHAHILKRIPKFGQGDPEPIALAKDLIAFIRERYAVQPHYRGGVYLPGFWSMSNHVAFGTLSGTLPSGRKRGKAFTPGITPSPNATKELTQAIRDVASLNPLDMPNNIAFNCKIAPVPDEPHERFVDNVTAYAKSYFDLGGMQIQFNIVTSAILRDAMAHPEQYRDLMVRISGYNAYFVELNKEMQIELIERAEFR